MVAGAIHMQMSWVCSRGEGLRGGGHKLQPGEAAALIAQALGEGRRGAGAAGGGGLCLALAATGLPACTMFSR